MPARSPEEVHASLSAAINNGDLDAYARLYEEGAAMVVPPEGRQACGTEAIRAATKQLLALDPVLRIEVLEKHEANGLSLSHSHWWLSGTDDGERVEMSGRGTLICRRQPDGEWLVVLENTMTPD
jgi:ketosteroid isomerase-like protein